MEKEKQLISHVRDALSQSLAVSAGIGVLSAGATTVEPQSVLSALRGESNPSVSSTSHMVAAALADDVTSNALVNIRVSSTSAGDCFFML